MQGYKPQYNDHAHYSYDGHNVDAELLADCIAIDGHPHADEIRELMTATYRPEQLHNNGDICDYYNEQGDNLARVTSERRTINKADLAEQASFNGVLWDSLSESYTQFVKLTQRWKNGYNPEMIKPDARFARRVAETKLRMQKNSRVRLRMTRRARDLGIIK